MSHQDVFLAKSLENLHGAELAFNHESYNVSVSRAYYAAFHAARAALYRYGFTPTTDHKTVQSLFNSELCNRRKIFPATLKSLLLDMQNRRGIADYELTMTSKSEAAKQFKKAQGFVITIQQEIMR